MSPMWIVLTVLGHVTGSWGPQPPDADIVECSARAASFQEEIRLAMWAHPGMHFPGNPSPAQVTVACISAAARPPLAASDQP